jgi:hypothetical protein
MRYARRTIITNTARQAPTIIGIKLEFLSISAEQTFSKIKTKIRNQISISYIPTA